MKQAIKLIEAVTAFLIALAMLAAVVRVLP